MAAHMSVTKRIKHHDLGRSALTTIALGHRAALFCLGATSIFRPSREDEAFVRVDASDDVAETALESGDHGVD